MREKWFGNASIVEIILVVILVIFMIMFLIMLASGEQDSLWTYLRSPVMEMTMGELFLLVVFMRFLFRR